MKFKGRVISLLLVCIMMFSLAACGNKAEDKETGGKVTPTNAPSSDGGEATATPTEGGSDSTDDNGKYPLAEKRTIKVGTWYDIYYTSEHQSPEDNPKVTNNETAMMQIENVRAIEEKYNVEIIFQNMTWEGIMESINVSIMAGAPDCDIYMVDLQFGIPAVMNGLAQPIESYAAADSDIFTDQIVMRYLNLMGQDQSYLFSGNAINADSYPLAFNLDMLEELNLENPQDLWDRGEWTWEKWREYLIATTRDVDGDGSTDVFGYGGFWTTFLNQMLMSNGANIAGGFEENLTATSTIEVLDYIYQMYNVDKTAKPWNQDDWDVNGYLWKDGLVAFWPVAHWMLEKNVDLLEYEVGVVPWPVGPNGNKDTNAGYMTAGNYYIIPVGVEDPETVYNVFYDWTNWYNNDLSYRDDTEWAENCYVTERNFEYVVDMGSKQSFDIWGSLPGGFSLVPLMNGEKTGSQLAEENKLIIQEGLDQYFK